MHDVGASGFEVLEWADASDRRLGVEFESPPGGRVARPGPCGDAAISRILGVPLGRSRNQLGGFDRALTDRSGPRFLTMVVRAANEFTISPALLAVNALAETGRDDYFGAVDTAQIGLDHWERHRREIQRRLGRTFRTSIVTDPTNPNCTMIGGECHFRNERGRLTGRIYQFASAQEGLRAMAAHLRVLEQTLTDKTGGLFGWVGIPEPLQWSLVRLSYNPGKNNPGELAQRALADVDAGRDPRRNFPLRGPGDGKHPFRASVIRAAQAWHLANTVFARPLPCSPWR
jgi:hypothetical protein